MTRRYLASPEFERAPAGVHGIEAVTAPSGSPLPDLKDCLVGRPRAWRLVIWEPLITKAPSPPKAAPWCCYRHTIIFYHSPYIVWPFPKIWNCGGRLKINSGPTFAEWDQIETRLGTDDVVKFENEMFVCDTGRVVWANRRWWMVHTARRREAA